jgi:hypothetical protein
MANQAQPENPFMATPEFLKRIDRALRAKRDQIKRISGSVQMLADLAIFTSAKQVQVSCKNPLNAFGRKCFSQADEDGITLEILRRMGRQGAGVYAEMGVGDGLENNTLVLAALGWKGFWVGGETLKPRLDGRATDRFAYLQHWVTLDNLLGLFAEGLIRVNSTAVDVLSLDLDGNDYHFVEALLQASYTPKLFIVEYNAKFLPPIEFKINYDAKQEWQSDDYFGASLASFSKLFSRFGYRLVCCNSHTGSNAFFVRGDQAHLFDDVPSDINDLYMEPRYWLYRKYGHAPSVRTVELILNGPG